MKEAKALIYRELLPVDRQEVEEALSVGTARRAAEYVMRMAMNEPDGEWAQRICVRAIGDVRTEVAQAGLTGLGHLARRFRTLDLGVVLPAVRSHLADEKLGGVAEDALDDIAVFVQTPSE